jgi:predicted ATPase/DNA-binding XRE family transcriptional regulator
MAETFGAWLRHQRRTRDLTREELAAQIGCSPDTIRKLEHQQRKPSKQLLALILQTFDVPSENHATLIRLARFGADSVAEAAAPQILPLSLTPLLGRDEDLVLLHTVLARPQTKLVTILGTAGVGKTRLALELASQLQQQGRQVIWVALASVSAPSMVLGAICEACGVSLEDGQDAFAALAGVLRHQDMTLVIDNMEHVLAAASDLLQLLIRCPSLWMMVTSREPLGLDGEIEVSLSPLRLPSAEPASREAIETAPSVQLFLERAYARNPRWAPTVQDLADIVALCHLLGGLPLAIELAAAQTKHRSLAAILSDLRQSLEYLSHTHAHRPAHYQSLYAAFAGSYMALTPPQQRCLALLAMFPSGTSFSHLEAIVEPTERDTIFDHLCVLAEKHLVSQGSDERWGMLYVVRAYVEEHASSHRTEADQRRFQTLFQHLVDEWRANYRSTFSSELMYRLRHEHHNLHVWLDHLIINDPAAAGKAVHDLIPYWTGCGHSADARFWLNRLIPILETLPLEVQAPLYVDIGNSFRLVWGITTTQQLLERSLEIYTHLEDIRKYIWVLSGLGVLSYGAGRFVEAHRYWEQAYTLAQQEQLLVHAGFAANNLGSLYTVQERYDEAREWYTNGWSIFAELDHQAGLLMITLNRCGIDYLEGHYAGARLVLLDLMDRVAQSNDILLQGQAYLLLALLCLQQEDWHGVHDACWQSFLLHLQLEHPHKLLSSMYVYGLWLLGIGNVDAARSILVSYHSLLAERSLVSDPLLCPDAWPLNIRELVMSLVSEPSPCRYSLNDLVERMFAIEDQIPVAPFVDWIKPASHHKHPPHLQSTRLNNQRTPKQEGSSDVGAG